MASSPTKRGTQLENLPDSLEAYLRMSDSEDAKSSSIAFAENEKWATNEREEESTGLTSMELSELSQPAATGKPLWWMSSEDESSSALVTQTGAGTNATEELTKTQSSWLKSEPAPLMNEGEPVEIPEKTQDVFPPAETDPTGDGFMSPDAYLDTTENDKQRFFAAMEAAGVKPTFENHSDDEEDEVDVSFHLTEFSSAPDLNPDKEDKDVVEKDNSSAPLYSESSFESFSEKKQTHQTEEAIKREEVATSEALTSMSEESSLKLLVETEAAATEDRTTELIARAKEGAVDQTIESTNVGSLLEDYEESQVEIHQAGLSMGETSDLGAITDKILKEIEVESEFSVIKTAPVTLIHDESQSLAEEPTLDHPIPQEAPSILQDDTTTDHVSAASKTEENDVSSFGLDSAVGESVLHHHQSRIEEPSHDLDISFRSNRSLVQRSPPIKDVKTVVEDDTTSSSSVKIKSASIPESPSRSVSSAFTELSFARPKTPTKKSTIVSPSPKKATRKIGPSPRKSKDALKSPDKKQLAFDNAIKLLADTEKAIGKIVDVTDTVPKAATAAEGSIPSGFILMDVKELTELKDTIAELMECQQDLQNGFEHRGKENDTLKEEIRLLESILEKEQENSRKLMAKAGTTFPADAEKLKKDIDEQELLLHGYQLENEKLIMENKDLKKGLREAEKLALLKTEKLTREVSTLRLQVQERERTQTRTDFGAAQYQLKIEALEAQLESTRSNLMDREAELNLEIEKWKAQFEQALKAPMSPGKAAAITEMPLSEKAKEKYEARIVELEGKLQLLHDKEELLEDYTRRIVDKDAEMKDLRTALDIANSKLEVKEVKISDRKNVNSKRLNETSVAASDEVALLKDQIRSLEIAKDTVIKESETQIRTLQEDYHHMRRQFDKRIQDLDNQLKLADGEQNDHVIRIKDLEEKLAKTVSHNNSSSQEPVGISFREVQLRGQVLELEKLVDEQSVRIEMALQEKTTLEKQWLIRSQDKDSMIDSYEAKIVELQTAFKDKIFAVEEFKNLDEVLRLKGELEKTQLEVMSLQNRLEISEQTRKSVHETTMTILKQSQEESAKIAMDHHRQSMSALLSELKADNQTQFQSLVDKETAHLQEQLDASDKELQTSRLRVVELESLAQELESEVSAGKELCETLRKKICQLQEDLEQSRKGWPPSMHQFEALIQQIRDLETSAKKRESEIETLISLTREDAASAYEEDRLELVRLLAKKDQEILGFKGEVDSMVSSILQLKRSGVIL